MFFHTNLKKIAIILACIGILGLASEEPVPMPPDIVPETKLESEVKAPTQPVMQQPSEAEKTHSTHQASVTTPVNVLEFVLAYQIEAREPKEMVEADHPLEPGRSIYAFARLSAEKATPICFVWFKEGKEYYRFNTAVQLAKQWRTYASVKLKSGHWKVQLIIPDSQNILAERTFTVQ